MRVLAYITDLFFRVKVEETARRLGVRVKLVASQDEFSAELERRTSLIIIDLAAKGIDTLKLIDQAKSIVPRVPVVTYAAHVDKGQLERASEAGADYSMSRSKFSQELPGILTSLAKG